MTLSTAAFADRLAKLIGQSGLMAGTLKLQITNIGTLFIAGYSVSERQSRADCTLTVDANLLDAFLSGNKDPHWALMNGDISYCGDFAVARTFGSLFHHPEQR